jgi:F-box protein 11
MTAWTVPVKAEWALWGKAPEEVPFRLLRYSNGTVSPDNLGEVLARFSPGTPVIAPQVTVGWLSGQGQRNYVAIAIHGTPERGTHDSGPEMEFVSYFCVPYEQMAAGTVCYQAMYEGFREIRVPADDGAPVAAELAAWRPPATADALAMRVAALLLTGEPICVYGAEQVPVLTRLRFLDVVVSLLPYGMRSRLSASTCAGNAIGDPALRLFFADAPSQHDGHVVIWGQHDQTPIPGYAGDYLRWLMESADEPATRLGERKGHISFSERDILPLLEQLGVSPGGYARPTPGPARLGSGLSLREDSGHAPGELAAFMSYVHFNDDHDDGQISRFCERLSAEVGVQTGENFSIFYDRNISWGQIWSQRILEALDAATLLIPIITPGFFRSKECRAEVERFLEREQQLGRSDLILPVYYLSCREMDDPEFRKNDELAQILASRQFANWQHLRFEPFTSPTVRQEVAKLAISIRHTFERPPLQESATARGYHPPALPDIGRSAAKSISAPPPKTGRSTYVVDPYDSGDFTEVGMAINAARPGDIIVVKPGHYPESLVIDKPLEIIGDGPVADIVIEANGRDALLFRANIGKVSNLTLRQIGGAYGCNGVYITYGRLELERCDITCQSVSGIEIVNGADPRIRHNKIHHCQQAGIFVYDGGLGRLEDNEIFATVRAGVEIRAAGNPILRRNAIHDCRQAGVYVYDDGLGTLEDNDIFGNATSGVVIRTRGNPTLRINRINNCRQAGVYVYDAGLGTVEDNDICENYTYGVVTRTRGDPVVRRNRIYRNRYEPISRSQDGRGVFEDNDLTEDPPRKGRRPAWLGLFGNRE